MSASLLRGALSGENPGGHAVLRSADDVLSSACGPPAFPEKIIRRADVAGRVRIICMSGFLFRRTGCFAFCLALFCEFIGILPGNFYICLRGECVACLIGEVKRWFC